MRRGLVVKEQVKRVELIEKENYTCNAIAELDEEELLKYEGRKCIDEDDNEIANEDDKENAS